MKKPEISSQQTDPAGLSRRGGSASEASTEIPADIGSRYVDSASKELQKDAPNPIVVNGGDVAGSRHFADQDESWGYGKTNDGASTRPGKDTTDLSGGPGGWVPLGGFKHYEQKL